MERAEWLKMIRAEAEALYDLLAPAYWVKFGLYANATHRQYIEKFLSQMGAQRTILDAACGAGRYDGLLLDAGHTVLGIDQSVNMLARAREVFPQERFPQLHYVKMGLQEMDFRAEFDGIICIDALEHICPEDWPGILTRFQKGLKPGGMLFVTIEIADLDEVREAYNRAEKQGLPVVFGEVVEEINVADPLAAVPGEQPISGQHAYRSVYHYYPSLEQVHAWFDQSGLAIKEEGSGDGYTHLLARKKA